jgi:hypothetical protein
MSVIEPGPLIDVFKASETGILADQVAKPAAINALDTLMIFAKSI